MKTPTVLATAAALLALAMLPALPVATAIEPCDKYGLCLPPPPTLVDGCHVRARVLTADLPTEGCAPAATLYVCYPEYYGGSPGGFFGNLRLDCHEVLTLA